MKGDEREKVGEEHTHSPSFPCGFPLAREIQACAGE
jgi:hypothetical protein